MKQSIVVIAACLVWSSPGFGSGANPNATYCYGGGTVGAIGGGGGGGGGGASCVANNAAASFGASYLTNQESALTPLACTAGAPQIVAEHLWASSFGTSELQPTQTDDDKFLLKTTEPPSAIIEIDTSDALNDFSTMPDVPAAFASGPGAGHLMGCPSTVMEGALHRTWRAFGNSFYYGDPTASAVSDPGAFQYFACWQPIALGYSTAYQYRQWGTSGTPEVMCGAAGYAGFDYYQCVYCLRHPDDGVSIGDPQSWNGITTTRTTVGSGSGYYITSNARSTANKSLFWSGAVIDYPPMWMSLYWVGKFMANNAMTDLTGTKYLFPIRREVRVINNSMPSGSCSTSSTQGGNGMHPSCARSNPYRGDSSFHSIWNFLDSTFGPFMSGAAVGTDTPLAGAIWDGANDYISGGFMPSGNSAGWCSTCAQNHIIVLSAGNTCHDLGQGAIPVSAYDSTIACTGACDYTLSSCTSRGRDNTCDGTDPVWPPQIASKMFNTDLLPSTPGTQNLYFDAIGIGPNSAALQQAASQGAGIFVDASRDPTSIHDALFSILNGLARVAVTATATPVNSVEAGTGGQAELIPQFIPKNGESIWDGHLYKTYFYSEFAGGCTSQGQSIPFPNADSTTTIQCPCLNGSCSGRYNVDANFNFVNKANDGTLHAISYSQLVAFYTANGRFPTPLEFLSYPLFTPVWDTGAIMKDFVNHPWYNRVAYTVIDSNADGKITAADGLTQITATSSGVTPAIADTLTPYLGIVGTNFCSRLGALGIGITYPDTSTANTYRSCAVGILNYALGRDLYDADGDGSAMDNRPLMLGDIYHSTPMDIGPPTPELACDFNLRRCAATIFNVNHQTDSTNWQALDYPATYYTDQGAVVTGSSPGPLDAYHAWVNQQTFQNKMPGVRVFGANDGWIHAIQFSCYAGLSTTTNLPKYYGGAGHSSCVGRTTDNGSELWAFIPTDQLPKLAQMALKKHQVFNDLTPMVRDVYVGSAAIKGVSDLHTVAIFGERNGGTHYSALDVTDPTNPRFLWMFPGIGSVDELRAGMSWGEYLSGSPPIGPIRLSTSIAGSPTYQAQPFHETWVVMLPGGYDRFAAKGHGFWMLDAWTGTKYWEAWGATGMDFSFAATPAMVAWGTREVAPTGLLNNGFFDTAVLADVGGTVWVARFNDLPTFAVNANGENLITNWGVGRAFRSFDADDSGSTHVYKMQNRLPFFTMPSLGRMPDSGLLRAFLGSGDRGNIDDQFLGSCSGGNMLACGKQAAVTMAQRDQDIGVSTLRGGSESYDGTVNANLTVGGTVTYNPASAAACTPAANTLNVCIGGTSTNWTPASPNQPQVVCVNTTSGEQCSYIKPSDLSTVTNFNPATGANGSIANVYNTSGNGYYSRFYAMTLFRPSPSNRALFNSSTQNTYDSARITENSAACGTGATGLCNAFPSGVLSSFAYPETSASFNSPSLTDGSSDGFYFYYPNIDERTSGNVLLANGCLLWSTIQPTSPCATDADCAAFSVGIAGSGTIEPGQCNTVAHECARSTQCNVVGGSSAGHIYQANAMTSSGQCPLVNTPGPRVTFGTILPPPPPQQITFINSLGLTQRAVVVPVGLPGNLLTPPAASGQLFRTYYNLEVSQSVHNCRHNGVCN